MKKYGRGPGFCEGVRAPGKSSLLANKITDGKTSGGRSGMSGGHRFPFQEGDEWFLAKIKVNPAFGREVGV
jgi:hypothetical protein